MVIVNQNSSADINLVDNSRRITAGCPHEPQMMSSCNQFVIPPKNTIYKHPHAFLLVQLTNKHDVGILGRSNQKNQKQSKKMGM
jgi:hypothetical protein